MNLILFEPHELTSPLSRADRRAVHVLEVLRRAPGDTFDVGLLNGPRGRATLLSTDDAALTLAHLGERVLRTETAVISALAIARAKLGLM